MIKIYNKFVDYFIPKELKFSSLYELSRVKLIISFTIISGLLAFVMAMARFSIEGIPTHTLYLLFSISIIAMVGPFFIKYTNKYSSYALFIASLGIVVITVRAISSGGITSAAVAWFLLLPLIISLVLGISYVYFITILCVAGIWAVYLLPKLNLFSIDYFADPVVNTIVYTILILAIGLIGSFYRVMINQYINNVHNAERSKFNSLGLMSGGVAHEINNPLAVIKLVVSRLEKNITGQLLDVDQKEKFIKDIKRCKNSIDDISNRVGLLAELSNTKITNKIILNIDVAVSVVLERLSSKIKHKNIVVSVNYENKNLMVNASVIEKILYSLLLNSIDSISDLNDKWIEINFKSMEDRLFISIKDSGHGIDPKIAAYIFDPFFTTKSVGEGAGLGLGIIKNIIEQNGGNIIYNKDSPHTEFQIVMKNS